MSSSPRCRPAVSAEQPHSHHHAQRPLFARRRGSTHGSTTCSSTSSFSDDEDAITPCPPQSNSCQQQQQQQQEEEGDKECASRQQQQQQQREQNTHRPSAQRLESWRSSQVISMHDHDGPHPHLDGDSGENGVFEVDATTLWRRMLVIQRIFGCYNSARMRAALDLGVDDGFVPSRTCLDLLNDSIDQLPEESRKQVEQFLEHGETASSASRRKTWRQRLHEMHVFA